MIVVASLELLIASPTLFAEVIVLASRVEIFIHLSLKVFL